MAMEAGPNDIVEWLWTLTETNVKRKNLENQQNK